MIFPSQFDFINVDNLEGFFHGWWKTKILNKTNNLNFCNNQEEMKKILNNNKKKKKFKKKI